MSNKSDPIPPLNFGTLPDGSYDKHIKFYQRIIKLFAERKIDCKELNSLTYTLDKMYNMTKTHYDIEKRLDELEKLAGLENKTLKETNNPQTYKTIST